MEPAVYRLGRAIVELTSIQAARIDHIKKKRSLK